MTLDEVLASLQEQLDWRGSGGRPQGTLTLNRDQAELVASLLRAERAHALDQVGGTQTASPLKTSPEPS